jgi:ribosome-associated translation inhibitor RaiA
MTVETSSDVRVSTRGAVDDEAAKRVAEQVAGVVHLASAPVLDAHAELHQHPNPSVERPALAKATVDVGGSPVRAQAAASTMGEAIDLLQARLRHRLEVVRSRLGARQRRGAAAEHGEWRHGDSPAHRGEFYPRPPEEREVIRQRAYDNEPRSLEEAFYQLHVLDYDFLLFVDAGTGLDSLLYHPKRGSFPHLARAADSTPPPARLVDTVIDSQTAPQLSLDQARSLLEGSDAPFAFYRDAGTGRGNVLYRRFDGHYGLATPA